MIHFEHIFQIGWGINHQLQQWLEVTFQQWIATPPTWRWLGAQQECICLWRWTTLLLHVGGTQGSFFLFCGVFFFVFGVSQLHLFYNIDQIPIRCWKRLMIFGVEKIHRILIVFNLNLHKAPSQWNMFQPLLTKDIPNFISVGPVSLADLKHRNGGYVSAGDPWSPISWWNIWDVERRRGCFLSNLPMFDFHSCTFLCHKLALLRIPGV